MSDAAHLNKSAGAALQLPTEERLQQLRQPRWIGYTRAQQVLAKLDELLEHPQTHRMPGMLLVSETNNGTTTIADRFASFHPARKNSNGDGMAVPVLLIQAPPVPDENRLYVQILDTLGAPYKPDASAANGESQVLTLLRAVGVRMLIIDEIHHVIAGGLQKQRQFFYVIKYLANELRIPLVGVGTIDALRAIQSDPQLANRFEPMGLPSWKLDEEFQKLLASFERTLPLEEPSQLASSALTTKLLLLSEGTIGELCKLLIQAAAYANIGDRKWINESVIAAIEWIPPSKRKGHTGRMF